ncbi:hypothetical protein E2320_013936 [Naja naja]|nr:hypothetical protein E2320_013936 [Naja naja]
MQPVKSPFFPCIALSSLAGSWLSVWAVRQSRGAFSLRVPPLSNLAFFFLFNLNFDLAAPPLSSAWKRTPSHWPSEQLCLPPPSPPGGDTPPFERQAEKPIGGCNSGFLPSSSFGGPGHAPLERPGTFGTARSWRRRLASWCDGRHASKPAEHGEGATVLTPRVGSARHILEILLFPPN